MASTTILICLSICVAFSAALVVKTNTDNLVSVVQVFRHGQRNPISWYPNDPWKNESLYDLGAGQLTKKGKQVHYELGTFTRGRYGKFLPTKYDDDWFRAQTTDVDRTHMSCQSNLAGMFSPTKNETWNENLKWQPIPVHPTDSDVISGSPNCAIYRTESANILVTDPVYVALNEEFADLYQYLTNYTGSNVTTVATVYSIYDDLHIEELLGFELPAWSESVYPEPMKTLTASAFVSFSFTTEQKRLGAGLWLKTNIYDFFTNIFNDTSSYQKFQMWSAHDTSIASILNTLGAFDPHYPAFASTLYFELRNNSGSPFINIYHRDDDLDIFEPITVYGCSFDCALEDFATAMSDYLLDQDTWTAECAANSTSYTDLETALSDEQVAEVIQHIEEILSSKLGSQSETV